MRSLLRTDYTVAWICALPSELTAAICMLDEEHSALPRNLQDNKIYTLGCIAGHNVVVVCLPAGQTGTNSAAAVTSQLRYSFPNVRFGLIVGIGGGAPSERHDIRLGDVVVSIPGKSSTGVIQYDFGRTVAEGRFVRDTILNAPPQILLSAVNTVRAKHNIGDRRMDTILSGIQCSSLGPAYVYQGIDNDMLFQADYDHEEEYETCAQCENSLIVPRTARHSNRPVIHYGTIASANQVMRHGKTRENCRKELDVLCFEMEAAGLMNNLPCLVVRGICDYSDSHKNKGWQEYAAITAAAYSKELLHIVATDRPVSMQDRLADLEAQSHTERRTDAALVLGHELSFAGARSPQYFDDTDFLIVSKRSDWAMVTHDGSPFNVFDSLSDYDPEATLRSLARKKCPETAQWILKDERFKAWTEGQSHRCLWLSVGSGKTIIATSVIQYLLHTASPADGPVFHFFYTQLHRSRSQARDLVESLAKQMISYFEMTQMNVPPRVKARIKKYYGPRGQKPILDDLLDDVIFPLSVSISSATFVVDGLDECESAESHKVLTVLRRLIQHGIFRLFVSGREVLDVRNSINGSVELPISSLDTKDDIRRFIDWKVDEKMRERPLTEDEDILREVKRCLNDKADRMILWVNLQLEVLWDECFDAADVLRAIENMPKDLDETYTRCLSRVDERQSRTARRVLHYLVGAIKPFKTRQLLEALAIDSHTGIVDRDRILQVQDLLRFCANLVIRDQNDQIILAHHSVRQYLQAVGYAQYFTLSPALELGYLCVLHLSSPTYSRAVAAPSQAAPAVDISQVSNAVLSNFNLGLRKWGLKSSKTSKPLLLRSQTRAADPATFRDLPEFFHFAREQWLLLTRFMEESGDYWSMFRILALEPDLTYRLHPWRSIGISLDSHFSALLGWSINHDHSPLLSALIVSKDPKPRTDIFDLPLTSYDNHFPLHLAAKLGHTRTFGQLSHICNRDKLDGWSRTALHYACEGGHNEICFNLLATVIASKPPKRDDQGQTFIHLAAANGHTNLISSYFNPLNRISDKYVALKDYNGRTALSLAAMNGHKSDIRALWRLDFPRTILNEGDKDGRTPLMLAAMSHHVDCVYLLIKRGADDQLVDNQNATAFSLALSHLRTLPSSTMLGITKRSSWAEMVCVMLQHPQFAVSYARAAETLILLGGIPTWKDTEGCTLMHYAARHGHVRIVSTLMKDGATLFRQNYNHWTPLHEAAAQGHMSCVLEMCNDNHRANHIIKREIFSFIGSPLHLAAQNGHAQIVEAFLHEDPDSIKCVNNTGSTPLHFAAREGRVSIVQLLLDQPDCPVYKQDHHDNTALDLAVQEEHLSVAEISLKKMTVDKDTAGSQGSLLLIDAAAAGKHLTVALILKYTEYNVNTPAEFGMTALHFASRNGHFKVVEVLLKLGAVEINASTDSDQTFLTRGAPLGGSSSVATPQNHANVNTNAKDLSCRTALHWASENGHVMIVEALLQVEATDLNPIDYDGSTPLELAARADQLSIVTILMRQPTCIAFVEDLWDPAALHSAAEEGCVSLVHMLLGLAKSDINTVDPLGRTALHFAVRGCQVSVIRLLTSRIECNVNAKDRSGETPLHTAVSQGLFPSVLALLESERLDMNVRSAPLGWTALHLAATRVDSNKLLAALLATPGCEVDVEDHATCTPLHQAAAVGNLEAVRILLEKGANVHAIDAYGRTPLSHAAVSSKDKTVDIIQLLLDTGATVTTASKNGMTPLHWAVQSRSRKNVSTLLNAESINLSACDKIGLTAEGLARRTDQTGIADLIRAKQSVALSRKTAAKYVAKP